MELRQEARLGSEAWARTVGVRGHPRCPLFLAPSRINGAGMGVFTRVALPAGAFVTPYDGALFRGILEPEPRSGCRVADYALQISEDTNPVQRRPRRSCVNKRASKLYVLGVWPETRKERSTLRRGVVVARAPRLGRRGFGHMLNDAVHPEVTGKSNNCTFVIHTEARRAYIATIRAVRAGAELTVPYHVTYWAGRAETDAHSTYPRRLAAFCTAMKQARSRFRARDMELEEYLGRGRFMCTLGDGRSVVVDGDGESC